MRSELREKLLDFDGRAITILGEAEVQFGDEPGYVDALIGLLLDPAGHLCDGSSWLLKKALEDGHRLDVSQTEILIANFAKITAWAAQLHLCQLVQYLEIPSGSAERLMAELAPLAEHERPFLRAWAMDAILVLARQHEAYAEIGRTVLDRGQDDPAASVRARVRRLKQKS